MLQRLAAEFLGTAMLLCAVVGSGIMAERLSSGNVAVILLANSIATGAVLAVLILMFAPVSGAHFNPVVSLSAWLAGEMTVKDAMLFMVAQGCGAIFGVLVANAMFDLPAVFFSTKVRSGPGQWIGEFAATFGLITVITMISRSGSIARMAAAVALYITGAYWFTSSTSFANPAVTVARSLSDTFSGIRPIDAPMFIAAQMLGGISACLIVNRLFPKKS
jgi:glycerol uptake facilitator-like aquaporin